MVLDSQKSLVIFYICHVYPQYVPYVWRMLEEHGRKQFVAILFQFIPTIA